MTCPTLAPYVTAEVYTQADVDAACDLAHARDALADLLDRGVAGSGDCQEWDALCEQIKVEHDWSRITFICQIHQDHPATDPTVAPPRPVSRPGGAISQEVVT